MWFAAIKAERPLPQLPAETGNQARICIPRDFDPTIPPTAHLTFVRHLAINSIGSQKKKKKTHALRSNRNKLGEMAKFESKTKGAVGKSRTHGVCRMSIGYVEDSSSVIKTTSEWSSASRLFNNSRALTNSPMICRLASDESTGTCRFARRSLPILSKHLFLAMNRSALGVSWL